MSISAVLSQVMVLAQMVYAFESVHDPGVEIGRSFAVRILETFKYIETVTGLDCALRVYSYRNPEIVNLRELSFHETDEPLEAYDMEPSKVYLHSPNSKHKSLCWNTVFVVLNRDEPILRQKLLGNPLFDRFLFISPNAADLISAMGESGMLSKVAHKYGLYCEDNASAFKYLLEPGFYNGYFSSSNVLIVSKKTHNLKGRIFNTPILNLPPILVVDRDESGKFVGLSGSQMSFLKELELRANFTINYYGADDNIPLGKQLKNGTWTGYIGEIAHGKGDLGPIMGQMIQRFPLFSYVSWSYIESMPFCLKEPKAALHWHALVFPLSKTVWTFTLGSLGGFIIFFSFAVISQQVITGHSSFERFFQQAAFFPLALLLEQNFKIPRPNSGRIAALSLIWMSFLIGMVYKSNLVGYLTFPEKQAIPRTFRVLTGSMDFHVKIYSLSNGAVEVPFFTKSPNTDNQKFGKRLEVTGNAKECLEAATNDKTGCIMWKNILNTWRMKLMPGNPDMKSLYVTQDSAVVLYVGPVLKKHSIFYDEISRYSSSATEAGLITKWFTIQNHLEHKRAFQKFSNQTKDSEREDSDEGGGDRGLEKPLEMDNLVAVAFAYYFGIGIAVIFLILESGYYNCHKTVVNRVAFCTSRRIY